MGRRSIDDCINELYEIGKPIDVYFVNYTKWYGYTAYSREGRFYADTFRAIFNAIRKEVIWHENYKRRHSKNA